MKVVLFFIAFCFVVQSDAQDTANGKPNEQKLFVRLYDHTGEKIAKGDLMKGSDSSIEIKHQHKDISFPVRQISLIKTRRSAGHSILIGTAIGTVTGIVLIAAAGAADNPDPNITSDPSFGLAIAGTAAPFAGAISGGVAAVLRKRETIRINGDAEKWKTAREKLLHIK
jgi:hypothetical protein